MGERTYGKDSDGCSTCSRGECHSMTLMECLETWDDDDVAGGLARHVQELLGELTAARQRIAELEDALFGKDVDASEWLHGLEVFIEAAGIELAQNHAYITQQSHKYAAGLWDEEREQKDKRIAELEARVAELGAAEDENDQLRGIVSQQRGQIEALQKPEAVLPAAESLLRPRIVQVGLYSPADSPPVAVLRQRNEVEYEGPTLLAAYQALRGQKERGDGE